MAAGVKGQRPQLTWNRLQGDPCRHGPVACQRPVVLVSVRGGNATPWLLVQGLVARRELRVTKQGIVLLADLDDLRNLLVDVLLFDLFAPV